MSKVNNAESVAPVTPSESDWLLLLMPDSGAHRTREWRGRAVDADAAIEQAMDENPGWSVHTFGPDVNAKPTPSPDREKLIAEADGWLDADLVARHAMSALDTIRRLRAALAVPPVVKKAPAPVTIAHAKKDGKTSALVDAVLAAANERGIAVTIVPPVVNEAKLAEIILEEFTRWAIGPRPGQAPFVGRFEAHIAAVLVERQREWLGEER